MIKDVIMRECCVFSRLSVKRTLSGHFRNVRKRRTWVRGHDAHRLNLYPKSMPYDGRIPGVCLSRGSLRGRFFDRQDLLRHGYL
jgi:hypothetical protein